jgi:tetratricopeptide (TPR) repeat protein
MSRMMDNLARALGGRDDSARPELHLIRGGIVPSPEAAAEIRADRKRKRSPIVYSAVAVAAVTGIFVALEFGWPLKPPTAAPSPGSHPTGSAAPSLRALELVRTGNLPQAEELLRTYLSANPAAKTARINHAYVLKALGRFEESERQSLEVLRRHGRDPYALNNLGVLYSATNRPALAEAALNEALDLRPTYAEARLNLARALERSRRIELALNQYRQYLSEPGITETAQDELKEHLRKLSSISAGLSQGEEKL